MKPHTLPSPQADAKSHSDRLQQLICDEIKAQGPMPFARYMQMALYQPGLGYYSAGARKLGAAGDFITAPELSSLFSRCVARQCAQVVAQAGGSILELGAGSGVMALDILRELEATHQSPTQYFILEISADLRERQQQLFQEKSPHLLSRVKWLDTLPENFTGIILANEVIDAMPVHKFLIEDPIKTLCVDIEEDQLVWKTISADSNLIDAINNLDIMFEKGYASEINVLVSAWIKSLSQCLTAGVILLIDYGFPRHEFYHPDRKQGTLMCHFQHHAHDNPLLYPGIQDITSHVDFTAIAEAADENNLSVAGFTNQAAFLISCGLTDMLEVVQDDATRFEFSQQIKRLTMPSEMGELFKVMALTKGFDEALIGFDLMNQIERL